MRYKETILLEEVGLGKSQGAIVNDIPHESHKPGSTKIILDDKLPAAFARLRACTPEPRVCVYGLLTSVPCIDPVAAERYSRKGGW